MLNDFLTKYSIYRTWKGDIANIRGKISQADIHPLSRLQIKEIGEFYQKMIGRSVPTYWHEYFYSRNGVFDVRYIPTCLYHSEIIYKLNNYKLRHAYVDKGIYDVWFADVNRPKTIIKNIGGYFYDDSKAISPEEALARCKNMATAVSKPTQEGMWGAGVKVFSVTEGITDGGKRIEDIFSSYGENFIIQERVRQHAEMNRLNPTSLNTLRVLSYRQDQEIYILYVVVRIGRKDKNVDNETAGGINADIDLSTGTILDCAYGTPAEKRILQTDVGTALKGFRIPSFEKLVGTVKELHLRLPYFNIVGWDFGIDEAEEPILIEWNRSPDLSQTAHGPAFGEMTEEIFNRLKTRKDSRFE